MDTLQSFCNSCGRENTHDVANSDGHSVGKNYVSNKSLICRGCREPSIRQEIFYGPHEDAFDAYMAEPDEIEYLPPRIWHLSPAWLAQLAQIDPALKELLDEVYSAANSRQSRLLAMGVRTVLDNVMVKIVTDVGSFKEKLKKMVEIGEISPKEKECLETVIDAGSAVSHRGFNPPKELLLDMIATMETIVRRHYLTGPMLASYKTRIPPAPSRVKPTTLPLSKKR